jgi:hypothetical protein
MKLKIKENHAGTMFLNDGSLIVLCSDVVPDALELVKKLKEEDSSRLY